MSCSLFLLFPFLSIWSDCVVGGGCVGVRESIWLCNCEFR